MKEILFFTLGFFSTFIFIYKAIPILRKFITDKPNSRSSHTRITPTAGGISFIFTTIFLNHFAKGFNIISLIPLAIVGFLDDKFKIPSPLRFIIQFCTVLFIFINSELKFDLSNNIKNPAFLILIYTAILILGTALINFINFMDGIDCLIASTLFIALFFIGLLESNITTLILSGCLLGFIPWNSSPSKVFMGDTGSTFLGAYYTMLCYGNLYSNSIHLLLVIFPILFDPFLVLILRFKDNQNIFKPHKLHLYQRLYAGGLNNLQVVSIYFFSILVNSLIYSYFNNKFLMVSNLTWILLGIYLNNKYAIPFKKVRS